MATKLTTHRVEIGPIVTERFMEGKEGGLRRMVAINGGVGHSIAREPQLLGALRIRELSWTSPTEQFLEYTGRTEFYH